MISGNPQINWPNIGQQLIARTDLRSKYVWVDEGVATTTNQ